MAENLRVPKISVIMPVYNGEKYLREAITSILNQTYDDFELILINDGSSDLTEHIILSFQDSKIIYIKNVQNLGIVETLNKGIRLSNGEFIARMDADDISHPTRFEKQIAVFNKHPEIGVCGTWFTLFGDNAENKDIKHPKDSEQIKLALLGYCPIGHPTAMMRKSLFTVFKYDQKFQAAEDYELWTRLSRNTKLYNIQESLLNYRFHSSNMSVLESEVQLKNSRKIIEIQLEYVGIEKNENYINYCGFLFSSSIPRLTTKELIKVIDFANLFEQKNSKKLFYSQQILKESLNKKLIVIFDYAIKDDLMLILYVLRNRNEILKGKSLKSNLKMIAKIILKR